MNQKKTALIDTSRFYLQNFVGAHLFVELRNDDVLACQGGSGGSQLGTVFVDCRLQ